MMNLDGNSSPAGSPGPASPYGVDGRGRVPSAAVSMVPVPPSDVDFTSRSRPASTTRSRTGTAASNASRDPTGKTQLIKLIRESKYDAAIEMLNSGEYEYDTTFLTEALATGVKLGINVPESIGAAFIKKGADVNYQNPADPMTILMTAIAGYDTRMAKILIKLGARFDLHDKYGEDAVHFAIYYGLPEVIITIMDQLTNGGTNVAAYKEYAAKVRARNKPPPLVYAVQQKKEEIAVILIDHGADVQSTDKKGVPVIYTAIENKLFKVVDDLLSHDIDIHIEDPNGYSPLHAAIDISYANKRVANTAEGKEQALKYTQIAKELINRGAPVNAASDLKIYNGATPLIVCAQNENPEVTKLLIEKGANVNLADHVS